MHWSPQRSTKPEAGGPVIHAAARYDFLVWLFTLGGERKLRERMLRLARLRPGEDVLDIGCGTGSLAILAKRQVGAQGTVQGIDASPEMIARACEKAQRAGVDVLFAEGTVQVLPLPDSKVDVVLSTLMLHHVPRKVHAQLVVEIKRVPRPGGRLWVVDFTKPAAEQKGLMDRFHRHGFIRPDDIIAELTGAGFGIIRSGPVGERNLHYILAGARPTSGLMADGLESDHAAADQCVSGPMMTRHSGRFLLAVAGIVGALALIGLHAGVALSFARLATDLTSSPSFYAVGAALVLLVVGKIGLLLWRLTRGRRAH